MINLLYKDLNYLTNLGWEKMSLKKELLNELSEIQLKDLAKSKGISLELNHTKSKYYKDWEEKDRLVDLIGDTKDLSLSEIEKFIVDAKS
jgi:hypothetical protein